MVSVTRRRHNGRWPHTLLILRLIAALRSARTEVAGLRAEVGALLADRTVLLAELDQRDDLIERLEGAVREGVPL